MKLKIYMSGHGKGGETNIVLAVTTTTTTTPTKTMKSSSAATAALNCCSLFVVLCCRHCWHGFDVAFSFELQFLYCFFFCSRPSLSFFLSLFY